MEPVLIVAVVVVLVPVIWWIAVYNRITNLKNTTKESWSDIDVELKRRYDLIPNLVETVKGYAKHERETLERVVPTEQEPVAAEAEDDDVPAAAADEPAAAAGGA